MAIIQMLFPAVFYVAASFLADWGKSLLMRSFQMAGFVFYHIICALAVLAFCFMYFRMGMSEKYRNTYYVIGLFAGGFLPIAVLGLAGYVVGGSIAVHFWNQLFLCCIVSLASLSAAVWQLRAIKRSKK